MCGLKGKKWGEGTDNQMGKKYWERKAIACGRYRAGRETEKGKNKGGKLLKVKRREKVVTDLRTAQCLQLVPLK